MFLILGAVGGDGENEDDKEKEEEAERERLEAIKEAEDRRKEKHRKMEEEREKMRQEIRDKVSLHIILTMWSGWSKVSSLGKDTLQVPFCGVGERGQYELRFLLWGN